MFGINLVGKNILLIMKEETAKETAENADTDTPKSAVGALHESDKVGAPINYVLKGKVKRRKKKKGPVDGPRHPLTGNFAI